MEKLTWTKLADLQACTSSYLQPSLCSVGGKRSAEHPFQEGTSHVSSKGPVIFLQDELRQDSAKDGLGKCGSRAGEGGWSEIFCRKAEPLRPPCASLGALIGVSLPTGAAVHPAASWALGFAAVATGTALCVMLMVSVLWQRKVSATREINRLQ